MLSTSNARLIGVRLVQSYAQGSRASMHGEMPELEYDLTSDEFAPFRYATWVDFSLSRRIEINGSKVDVAGVWECTEWIQNQFFAVTDRRLKIGDLVQFDIRGEWFVLGQSSLDAGQYGYNAMTDAPVVAAPVPGSVTVQKFNLLSSVDARNS